MPYPTARTMLHVADEFARLKRWKRGTLSFYVFRDARRLDLIEEGADTTLGTFNRAMQYFSDNWPVDKAWPEGIERPSPSPRPLRSDEGASGGGAVSHGGTDE